MTLIRPPAPVGRNPAEPEWCQVCCTRHPLENVCPGEFAATGPERFGWKVSVETPTSMEAFGVMVAPSGMVWRARILTYPNTVWCVPGGKGAMKFVGRTPQAAEEQAIRYIEEFCAKRGYRLRNGLELTTRMPAPRTLAPESPRVEYRAVPARFPMVVPVKYSIAELLARAITRNVSESGVFIQTPLPPDSGNDLRFELVIHAEPVALEGKIVWIRRNPDTGRPPGMGVHLTTRSKDYVDFIRSLPKPKPAEGF